MPLTRHGRSTGLLLSVQSYFLISSLFRQAPKISLTRSTRLKNKVYLLSIPREILISLLRFAKVSQAKIN